MDGRANPRMDRKVIWALSLFLFIFILIFLFTYIFIFLFIFLFISLYLSLSLSLSRSLSLSLSLPLLLLLSVPISRCLSVPALCSVYFFCLVFCWSAWLVGWLVLLAGLVCSALIFLGAWPRLQRNMMESQKALTSGSNLALLL